jgi:hypothetical protein
MLPVLSGLLHCAVRRVVALRMEEADVRFGVPVKHTELAIADNRQGVVLQLGGWQVSPDPESKLRDATQGLL